MTTIIQPEVRGLASLESYKPPDERWGTLFEDIHTSGQLAMMDSKEIADLTPKHTPDGRQYTDDEIIAAYEAEFAAAEQAGEAFNYPNFIDGWFDWPIRSRFSFARNGEHTETEHAHVMLLALVRHPKDDGGSLIGLKHPGIAPGGRFDDKRKGGGEIYYWDSYYTMLGLAELGEWDLIRGQVENFADLIHRFGHVPNGNRTYYLTRSQPPLFSRMVRLLASHEGPHVLQEYGEALEIEYNYWMNGADDPTKLGAEEGDGFEHVLRMRGGEVLNRYWDASDKPRQESYKEDLETAAKLEEHLGRALTPQERSKLFRDIRAGAEAGTDYSGWLFRDGRNMFTIHTTDIASVKLNSLLYEHELTLAAMYRDRGDDAQAAAMVQKAQDRRRAVNKYCYDSRRGAYFDYDVVAGQRKTIWSAAANAFALNAGMPYADSHAHSVVRTLDRRLLKAGGIVTTSCRTTEQWDNVWALIQWEAIAGALRVGAIGDALRFTDVFLRNVDQTKRRNDGHYYEKYNPRKPGVFGKGGEYTCVEDISMTIGVDVALRTLRKRLRVWPSARQIVKPLLRRERHRRPVALSAGPLLLQDVDVPYILPDGNVPYRR